MINFKRILVPTDFSENADEALNFARSVIEKYGSELHLLHVIPDSTTAITLYDQIDHAIPADWTEKMREHSDQELARISTEKNPGTAAITRTTRQGDVFNEINNYAKESSIDLIVIGTHGRGATVHHMLGSLTDKIINKAACPVLTVPTSSHSFEMP